jgi:inner membrane protein
MPTFVSHSFIAFTLGKISQKSSYFPDTGYPLKFWLFSFVCAILPDIDVIPMSLGVPYIHMFGHRGFSHSILFVFLIAFILLFSGFREVERNSKQWWLLLIYFFFIGLSHILFDALTSGGLGVGFFMPFFSGRYFFSYRPIRVSPFSFLRFFDSEGLKILVSEFIWIWIPSIVLLTIVKLTVHRRKSKQNI